MADKFPDMSVPEPTHPVREARFITLVTEWRDIATGKVSFGSGSSSEQASCFYRKKLLPMVAQQLSNKLTHELRDPPAFGLISLVGSSPQTSILTAEALRPRHLLLITTAGVSESVDLIRDWFTNHHGGWPVPALIAVVCDPTDVKSMDQAVGTWLEALSQQRPSTHRIFIDASGGKKSMSVAAGMIALHRKIEVLYIDSKFDASLRLPEPGSEVIVGLSFLTDSDSLP